MKRRPKSQTWERDDWCCKKFQGSDLGGPKWEQVHRRVTEDRQTGELLEDVQIDANSAEKDYLYELSDQVVRNIHTTPRFRERKPDIAEVYLPPRIAVEAERQGLKPGFSLDLTVRRKDGKTGTSA